MQQRLEGATEYEQRGQGVNRSDAALRHGGGPGARLAPLHEQLLLVALLPAERAVEQWKQLRPAFDVESCDRRTTKLLPLVWRALVDAGADDPQLSSLLAIVHRTRSKNELLFEQLRSALEVLGEAGVRNLTLKGVPLSLLHYRDLSLRPMADIDLLVEPGNVPRAMAALERAGWQFEGQLPADFVARLFEVTYRSPDGIGVLDLHWRLEPWVTRDLLGCDRALWAAAIPVDAGGQTLLAPAPHDLMLHVILHAYRSGWSEVPRWVPDVVVLLRGAEFDWSRFVNRVVTAHLVLPVRDALTYVSATFDASLPDAVLTTLRTTGSSRRELRKHRVASRPPPDRHWLFGEWPAVRTYWFRIGVSFTRIGALRALPAFLRGKTHVDHLLALPFVIARRRARSVLSREKKPLDG